MIEPGPPPLVLVSCGWPRDRELVGELIRSLGAEVASVPDLAALLGLLAEDRIDLVLADSTGGVEGLHDLFRRLDGRAESNELPMVLLADPEELGTLADLITRRFNAVLLTKPVAREQLAAAVEAGLRFRERHRQVRDLLRQLEFSNAELQRRRDEAAEEARRKTRFLAAISHDIRTPVNALILACHLLRALDRQGPAPGEVRDLTDGLLANASALVELVNDLLDIARYDQGKLEFAESDFALGPFLDRTLDGMKPLAAEKGLDLVGEVDTPDAQIRTDRVKLARVVQNLVANAIKFTERGEIRLSARAEPESGLTLRVQDTGVGIPDTMRESIFDEFSQLRNPERDRTKGTGLGLAICRRLVTAMGGEIRVDEVPPGQVGSIFRVTLPPARVLGPRRPSGPERAEPRGAGPLGRFTGRVLVVEDHEPSRVLLHRLLEQSGLAVEVAGTGREALERIERSRPDLVLMDLMMPEMGGLEALKQIRGRPDCQGLPVVILTGDLGHRAEDDLERSGATACLSKPIEFPRLAELLTRLVPAAPP